MFGVPVLAQVMSSPTEPMNSASGTQKKLYLASVSISPQPYPPGLSQVGPSEHGQAEAGEDGLGVAEARVELLRSVGIVRQIGQGRQRQFVADAGIVDRERGGEDAGAADGVGESRRWCEKGRGGADRAGAEPRRWIG